MFEIRLAPMCGITDHIFRTLCFEQGCDLAYTEMISAMGYLCAPDQRATQQLMIRGAGEPRLILQLFGKNPDTVAEAVKRICALGRYDGIDLNMGCPAKKIAPSGEGCGLMRTPDIARKMMEKAVHASSVPVSVKMRLGYDAEHINVLLYAHMAEDAGISSITIHGRTREQQYSGEADWAAIRMVKDSVSIPVCGNGDIFCASQAVDKQKTGQTDAVMVGRGAMGNPWIFRDIKSMMNGYTPVPVSYVEKRKMMIRHYCMMLESLPEPIAVREMRKHIGWYVKGIKGAGVFRAQINQCEESKTAIKLINAFFEALNETAPEIKECHE